MLFRLGQIMYLVGIGWFIAEMSEERIMGYFVLGLFFVALGYVLSGPPWAKD
jgi:hypothetical protein